MYIEPNSEIYLLENIPLDPTYEHTILFKSANAQRDWFKKWAIAHLTNQSYVRADAGKIRINRSADKLYTCNYIMFQNTSYGNKWFYAFVTSVSYISNEVCEISWTIDSLQIGTLSMSCKLALSRDSILRLITMGRTLLTRDLKLETSLIPAMLFPPDGMTILSA